MVSVDLPAPRLAWRWGPKHADPIVPFPVFVGFAGDLEGMLIESHDIASTRVPRRAHGFAQERKRGLTLILLEIRKTDAVAHEPGVDIGPFAPCQIVDCKRRSLALFPCQLGEKVPCRL